MAKLFQITLVGLLATLAGVAAGCSDSGGGKKRASGYFSGNTLVTVPPGGDDLGSLDPQEYVWREATIDSPDEVHGYPVGIASDGLFFASVEGNGGLDPFLELYDANGQLVTGDDNGAAGRDALLVGSLRAGSYTLLVWPSRDQETTGGYRLNVLPGTPGGEDLEFLRPGETIDPPASFEILGNGDVNTFIFSTSDEGFVTISVATSAGMPDLGLRLRNQRGELVVPFENPPMLADPSLTNIELPRGDYVLTVENGEFAASGEYSLTLTASP